ncbi:hypothetical protein TNCV_2698731 [Trichonephila clavipes]|nr:hypothetical protein TNCV_2698731 [Trichonephila clavipes]
MSLQRILKLEEVLELLNSLDSDESDIEIAVLFDASAQTDEHKGKENEVNTLDMAIVNARIIHKSINKNKIRNLNELRRAVTTFLSKKTVIRTKGIPRILTVPSDAK